MDNQLQMNGALQPSSLDEENVSVETRLAIIEEGIRKSYLSRLDEMRIAPIGSLKPIEDDFIENVRVYRIDEIVYQKLPV